MRGLFKKILYGFCLTLAFAMAQMAAFTPKAMADDMPMPSRYLSQWLTAHEQLTFEQVTITTEPLRAYYASRQYQPVWLEQERLNEKAQNVLTALGAAPDHGLDLERYHVSTIQALERALALHPSESVRIALSLEVLISDAAARYASDLAGIDANGAPRLTIAECLMALDSASDVGKHFTALAPQNNEYPAMQRVLTAYLHLAAQGGWGMLPQGPSLKPGMADARIATLTERLRMSGDLPENATAPVSEYRGTLVDAVKHFQLRHGLEPDGAVGGKTLTALNVPVETRIGQIAASMERMRWLPRDLGPHYVLVNIPGYYLKGMHNGKQEVGMKVIVGKAATPTPLFSNVITDVVFNPSWGVPSKIASRELLPKERAKPGYLSRAGYQLIARDGSVVSPDAVDPSDMGVYGLRQKPGNGNALGKVKFNIPNSDSIYLHDTANPGLFARTERSMSHGCVRLGDPRALARFMLGLEGWQQAQIDKTYDATQPKTVRIEPVPVYLVYWTSFVDDEGNAHFHSDIYGKDTKLMARFTPAKPQASKLALASR